MSFISGQVNSYKFGGDVSTCLIYFLLGRYLKHNSATTGMLFLLFFISPSVVTLIRGDRGSSIILIEKSRRGAYGSYEGS